MKYQENAFTNIVRYYFTLFAKQYSIEAQKTTPLTALSHLIQNTQYLLTQQESQFRILDSVAKECLIPLTYKYNKDLYGFIDRYVFKKDKGLPISLDKVNHYSDLTERLRIHFQEGVNTDKDIEKFLEIYYKYQIHSSQYVCAYDTVQKILNLGYPDEVDVTHLEINQLSESYANTKSGRPFDDLLPQETVEKKVLELSKDTDFLHADGRLKPTKIRDYLINDKNFEHVLSRSQLFERIKMAQEKLNIR